MNGHRMHNIRKAPQSDKEETCEFSTPMPILAYNTYEDTTYSLCICENSSTCGYGITCGKKNKKGWLLGDEEGLNAGSGHLSYERGYKAHCPSSFNSDMDFSFLGGDKCTEIYMIVTV